MFLLNKLSLLWHIGTKPGVWEAYTIKRQLGIASRVYAIKVKFTVSKNINSLSTQ